MSRVVMLFWIAVTCRVVQYLAYSTHSFGLEADYLKPETLISDPYTQRLANPRKCWADRILPSLARL